ncbi:hypothetical protein OEZ85_012266 [Tetradesmus obliquus]|uniref:Uncharacterized protein n=1 Tax=Tetradesmus obliquus TaxID=3088 RepID=A0ABY8TWT4_TETOB|nr:hypothetical protein OEZ85_012266 [Tetradesmus obliquus]
MQRPWESSRSTDDSMAASGGAKKKKGQAKKKKPTQAKTKTYNGCLPQAGKYTPVVYYSSHVKQTSSTHLFRRAFLLVSEFPTRRIGGIRSTATYLEAALLDHFVARLPERLLSAARLPASQTFPIETQGPTFRQRGMADALPGVFFETSATLVINAGSGSLPTRS